MTRRLVVAAGVLAVLGGGTLSACGGAADSGGSGGSIAATPAPPTPVCPAASRCYDFGDGTTGWPDANDDAHYANHDPYLKGTYRVGARQSGTYVMTAPVKASELADDYGVQIDLDATMGQNFPDSAAWGAVCWTQPLSQGRVSGFGVFVQPTTVTLGIFDQVTGAFTPLKTTSVDGKVKKQDANHLRLTCRQDTVDGTVAAHLEARLNGDDVGTVDYGESVKHREWQAADGLGLLAAGKDADVFYDNVDVAPAPPPSSG